MSLEKIKYFLYRHENSLKLPYNLKKLNGDCSVFRKRLYHSVFEYDIPLFNPEPCKFEFIPANECEFENPWKESFHQLYKGLHVRPGNDCRYKSKGRSIHCFRTIQSALDYAEGHSTPGQTPLVFVHTGIYTGEFLVIDSDVAIIGEFRLLTRWPNLFELLRFISKPALV